MIRIQIADGSRPFSPGVDFIQVRNREASARELTALVRRAMRVVPVLVNDRADVAVACGAAGVHLRAGSVAPGLIRGLGPLIISVACHSAEDVDRAEAEGADYALLAPIFRPLSKRDSRAPLGLETLARVCSSRAIKVIALGGITEANALQCVAAGASGIAAISLFL